MNTKFIGVTGVATCGKDTFFTLLKKECLKRYDINVISFALADALKEDMKELLFEKYDIDVFNCTPSEKEKIRPEIVKYARLKRNETKGRYWIEKLNSEIKNFSDEQKRLKNNIFCITDIRYDQYEKDEIHWLKKENSGVLIYIEKIISGGFVFPPANNDEKINDPKLRKAADYILSWSHGCSKKDLMCEMNKCIDFLNQIGMFDVNE